MTATVQCVSCERFTFRESAKHAAAGLGRCALMTDRPATFVTPTYPRQCPDHQPAPAETTAARIEWLRKVLCSEGA